MSLASLTSCVEQTPHLCKEDSETENHSTDHDADTCSTQPGKLIKSALRRKRGVNCSSKKVATEVQTDVDPLQRENDMLKEKLAGLKGKRDVDMLRNLIVLGKLKQERRSRGDASSDEEDLDFVGRESDSSAASSSGSVSPETSEEEVLTEGEEECSDEDGIDDRQRFEEDEQYFAVVERFVVLLDDLTVCAAQRLHDGDRDIFEYLTGLGARAADARIVLHSTRDCAGFEKWLTTISKAISKYRN